MVSRRGMEFLAHSLGRDPAGRGAVGPPPAGHGPRCPDSVKDCPGSREKRPCPPVTSCPLGTERPGGPGDAGTGQGVQPEVGHVGGVMLGGPKGGLGQSLPLQRPPTLKHTHTPRSRSPFGHSPGLDLQKGQGGPACTPDLIHVPSGTGERPGRGGAGSCPTGCPIGSTGDIACEGAPARPRRAAPVTRSHAMGGGGNGF